VLARRSLGRLILYRGNLGWCVRARGSLGRPILYRGNLGCCVRARGSLGCCVLIRDWTGLALGRSGLPRRVRRGRARGRDGERHERWHGLRYERLGGARQDYLAGDDGHTGRLRPIGLGLIGLGLIGLGLIGLGLIGLGLRPGLPGRGRAFGRLTRFWPGRVEPLRRLPRTAPARR
jgi:hypothetical protein